MSVKKIYENPEEMIKLAEFYIKMSQYQQKYDHPNVASDCFITAKSLLYWAKVILEGHKL